MPFPRRRGIISHQSTYHSMVSSQSTYLWGHPAPLTPGNPYRGGVPNTFTQANSVRNATPLPAALPTGRLSRDALSPVRHGVGRAAPPPLPSGRVYTPPHAFAREGEQSGAPFPPRSSWGILTRPEGRSPGRREGQTLESQEGVRTSGGHSRRTDEEVCLVEGPSLSAQLSTLPLLCDPTSRIGEGVSGD